MGARKPKSHLITKTICLILVLSLTGCLVASPEIVPEYTVPPISTGPVSTVEASPTLEPTPTGAIVVYDEFGNLVTSGDHFIRYLTISDVSVYEQAGDTFLDATVTNSYPQDIMCSVVVRFYDFGSQEVASANLQSGSGAYVLVLHRGKNRIYAQIDSDMSLLDLNFVLEYDMTVGVQPIN